MYISAIWNIKKEGLIENIYFAYRLYGYIHAFTAQILLAVLRVVINVKLFIEHLSVFLDMVNIKHNIEL